jgi:hypothetical protein
MVLLCKVLRGSLDSLASIAARLAIVRESGSGNGARDGDTGRDDRIF